MKRLWSVTVHGNKEVDEDGTYKVEAKNDLQAREKAVSKFIAEFNKTMADLHQRDLADDDLAKDKHFYDPITDAQIDYCETELHEEW